MILLSENDINSTAPYKVSVIEKCRAFFTTDFGVLYIVSFDRDDNAMNRTVYQFIILNANNKPSPRDKKLRDTIVSIVWNFFKCNNEVILYLCETGDGRQSMRSRLFSYWFSNFVNKGQFTMLQSSVKDEDGIDNYFAIICRNDYPEAKQVVAEFYENVLLFNQKPKQ